MLIGITVPMRRCLVRFGALAGVSVHGGSSVTGRYHDFIYMRSFTSETGGFTRDARCMCVSHVADRITIAMRAHLQQADVFASK